MTSTLTEQAPAPTQQRVDTIVSAVLAGVRQALDTNDVTYAEYDAAKQWLISVGESGEWPLFLDVWIESTVEQAANRNRAGSKGTILGPFHLTDVVELSTPAALPMRIDEPGERLTFSGTVRSADGTAIPGAIVDMWHADSDGLYSGFADGVPAGNLRGKVTADSAGSFEVHTVLPAPYEVPKSGPCGVLIAAAGWSAFRPAHLHVIVSAPGHDSLTTQLYFDGGEFLSNDIATAVKPELVLTPVAVDGGKAASYDFVLPTA